MHDEVKVLTVAMLNSIGMAGSSFLRRSTRLLNSSLYLYAIVLGAQSSDKSLLTILVNHSPFHQTQRTLTR